MKKMQEKIFLKGKSNHIASILNDSKLFVLSSDYEGMPNALIEAITVGMPVISTDCPCGGSRMLIENYKNGILTEVGNQNDLEKAMRTILNDEEIQNAMSNLNLLKRNEFTIEKIFAEWQQFLFRSN